MYAVVRAGGAQQRVAVGDVLDVNRLPAEPGATVTFPAVLVVDDGSVTVDPERLARAAVTAEVLGTGKGPKIDIGKYKNKTRYRRRMGHRQPLTRVRVTDIDIDGREG